jgi:Fe-S-cluster containining protein
MLNLQREFHCGHSGACCTSGWHIPVESATHAAVAEAVRAGRLQLPRGRPGVTQDEPWIDTQHSPEGAVGVLNLRADGACVFFDPDAGRFCAIQRALGHDALPLTCQQFPRISVLDDRGAHVALSHFCPTVAATLISENLPAVEIVRLADGDPARRRVEGFDAREAVPPFLRPGVAFDLPGYDAWERGIVRALGRPGADPDTTLATIADAAEDLRGWRPSRGSLSGDVERVLGTLAGSRTVPSHASDYAAMACLFDTVAASVPEGLPRPALPTNWEAADGAWVAPAWARGLSGPVGRFLAAKAFASSIAWQGEGVRTQIMGLLAARAALRVEAARLAEAAGRACDAGMLVEAACAADALIEHLSDRPTMVRRWAGLEVLSPGAFLAGLGLGLGDAP